MSRRAQHCEFYIKIMGRTLVSRWTRCHVVERGGFWARKAEAEATTTASISKEIHFPKAKCWYSPSKFSLFSYWLLSVLVKILVCHERGPWFEPCLRPIFFLTHLASWFEIFFETFQMMSLRKSKVSLKNEKSLLKKNFFKSFFIKEKSSLLMIL